MRKSTQRTIAILMIVLAFLITSGAISVAYASSRGINTFHVVTQLRIVHTSHRMHLP